MTEVKRSDSSGDDFFAYLAKYLRRLPLPPEGFNPLTTSPDELQKFGLAAPPDAGTEPDLFEFWARMFKAPLRFIDPQFPHPEMLPRLRLPHYRQRPLGVLSRQRRLHSREKSRNWSGIYVRPPHGRRLDYVTAKGVASAAVFDGNSLFRSAQTAKYAPVDPCRQFAIDYNTAAPTGDSNGVFQAISAMAGSGCFARVQEDKLVPPNPTAPIKSFRPLSAF